MLRDVVTGLLWAGLAFAYFLLVMSLSPLQGAEEAWNLLVILAGGFAAILFLAVFMDVREDRFGRARLAEMHGHDQRVNRAGECAAAERLPASASRLREHCGQRIRSDGADHSLPVQAWAGIASKVPRMKAGTAGTGCRRAAGRCWAASAAARRPAPRRQARFHVAVLR
jgi:hypothetical protein